MHLRKILRQVNIDSMTKFYEGGVRAFVIPHGSGKILHARSRAGAASSCRHKVSFWQASKHAEFDALEKIGNRDIHSTVILFRVLPASHPKAQVHLTEDWALGSADMCKMCVERLKKTPRARNICWLTPDASSANQLRPAVPYEPVLTLSFMRYQNHVKNKRPHERPQDYQ